MDILVPPQNLAAGHQNFPAVEKEACSLFSKPGFFLGSNPILSCLECLTALEDVPNRSETFVQ